MPSMARVKIVPWLGLTLTVWCFCVYSETAKWKINTRLYFSKPFSTLWLEYRNRSMAVSLPGRLLGAGVHKNIIAVPVVFKVWLNRTILLTVWRRFQFGFWIALSVLRQSVMITAFWMWLDEIQYSAWSMP